MSLIAMMVCALVGGALVAESTEHRHPHWTGLAGIVLVYAAGVLSTQ